MVLIGISAGGERYGVPASRIIEVIPVPFLRRLPGTPEFVAGVFDFHGKLVPVVDLSALLAGRVARQVLSTRILLVDFQPANTSESLVLGLLAEDAMEAIACAREELRSAGFHGREAPYAGDILVRGEELIQELNVDHLLNAENQMQLFGAAQP